MKKSTLSDGIYAELGRVPLSVTRQIQIVKFAIRSWSLDDKTLVKKAFKVQLHDDIKGHFNWISEVTTMMKDNNMYELQPSMYDIGTRLKEKFKRELLSRLHSCGEAKKLRTYALFKQVMKCEPYLGRPFLASYFLAS